MLLKFAFSSIWHGTSTTCPILIAFLIYETTLISKLVFLVILIALDHSFLDSFDNPFHFLSQNIGLAQISWLDLFKSWQILIFSESKFKKIISAICWSPWLFRIWSIIGWWQAEVVLFTTGSTTGDSFAFLLDWFSDSISSIDDLLFVVSWFWGISRLF